MPCYANLLIAKFVCPTFVARQVLYSGFITAFSQKIAAADNAVDESWQSELKW